MLPLAEISRPDGREAVNRLAEAACRVEQLVLDAASPAPRPFRQTSQLLSEMCKAVRGALYGFLDVLGADDLLQAQELQRAAQAQLDSATQQIPALARAQDNLLLLMSSSESQLLDLLTHRLLESPERGLIGADQLGQAAAKAIIGEFEQPVDGIGLGALWSTVVAETLFDYDRFCSIARTLYSLISGQNTFDSLAIDPAWLDRHRRALIAFIDSGELLQNMISTAPHDRAVVRSLLLYVQDIFEGACKHFAATILAVIGTKPYDQAMTGRSAPLVHHVNDNPTTRMLAEGLLGRLRNSSGHYDFEVRGDLVVLDPGPNELPMSGPTFTNELLYFTESAMALCLAFEIALAQRGTPTPPLQEHSLLSPTHVVRLMLASSGLSDVSIAVVEDLIFVEGTGQLSSPIATVGGLLTALPDNLATLIIEWDEGGQNRVLNVPLALARLYSLQSDEFDRELAFMELCCLTTLDGSPFMTQAGFRHSVALKAGSVVKSAPLEMASMFRRLRDLAARTGDDHCAEVLRLVMRVQRLLAQGEVAEPAATRALDELSEWERTPVTQVFAE